MEEFGVITPQDIGLINEIERSFKGRLDLKFCKKLAELLQKLFERSIPSFELKEVTDKAMVLDGVLLGYPEREIRAGVDFIKGQGSDVAKVKTPYKDIWLFARVNATNEIHPETTRFLQRWGDALLYAYSLIRNQEDFGSLAFEIGLPEPVLKMPAPPSIVGHPEVQARSAKHRWKKRRAELRSEPSLLPFKFDGVLSEKVGGAGIGAEGYDIKIVRDENGQRRVVEKYVSEANPKWRIWSYDQDSQPYRQIFFARAAYEVGHAVGFHDVSPVQLRLYQPGEKNTFFDRDAARWMSGLEDFYGEDPYELLDSLSEPSESHRKWMQLEGILSVPPWKLWNVAAYGEFVELFGDSLVRGDLFRLFTNSIFSLETRMPPQSRNADSHLLANLRVRKHDGTWTLRWIDYGHAFYPISKKDGDTLLEYLKVHVAYIRAHGYPLLKAIVELDDRTIARIAENVFGKRILEMLADSYLEVFKNAPDGTKVPKKFIVRWILRKRLKDMRAQFVRSIKHRRMIFRKFHAWLIDSTADLGEEEVKARVMRTELRSEKSTVNRPQSTVHGPSSLRSAMFRGGEAIAGHRLYRSVHNDNRRAELGRAPLLVSDADLEVVGEAAQSAYRILSDSNTWSTFCSILGLISGKTSIGYAWDRKFLDLGFEAVIGADAKLRGQPSALVAVLPEELARIQAVNQALGPIVYNGKKYNPILVADKPEKAADILRESLYVEEAFYVTPEAAAYETIFKAARKNPFSQILPFGQAKMDDLRSKVLRLLESVDQVHAMIEHTAQMA